MCVYECVCVRERKGRREGEIGKDGKREGWRKGGREREIEVGFGGKLLHIFTQWAISSFSFFIVLSSFY